jgi:hypothetical protein
MVDDPAVFQLNALFFKLFNGYKGGQGVLPGQVVHCILAIKFAPGAPAASRLVRHSATHPVCYMAALVTTVPPVLVRHVVCPGSGNLIDTCSS